MASATLRTTEGLETESSPRLSRCVLGGNSLRVGGEHHAGWVVNPLAAHLAGIVDWLTMAFWRIRSAAVAAAPAIWERMYACGI